MTRLTLIPLVAVVLSSAPVLAGPELTKAYILSIIKDAKPDIDECGAALRGEVVKAKFTIESNGDVSNVKIQGKHAKDGVGSCMRAKLSQLKFGPSLKATPVTFPFRFGAEVKAPAETTSASMSSEFAAAPPPKKAGDRLDRKEIADLLKVLTSNMGVCGTGVVKTQFNIQPDGLVRNIVVDDENADSQMGKCVRSKLSRARFPAAKAASPVEFSFRLE